MKPLKTSNQWYKQGVADEKRHTRDAVQHFKQRQWIACPESPWECAECGKEIIFACITDFETAVCIDCALEQDFGKELIK